MKALSAIFEKKTWKTYVLLSDGEMDEGSNWEALMFASHHQLSNLISIIDYNKLQSLDTIEATLNLEPLVKKLESFGAKVLEIDGHNHDELEKAFNQETTAPKVILANTIKGKGVDFMENNVAWHYKSPNDEELNYAIRNLESE